MKLELEVPFWADWIAADSNGCIWVFAIKGFLLIV